MDQDFDAGVENQLKKAIPTKVILAPHADIRDQYAMSALTSLIPHIAAFEVLTEGQILSVVDRAFVIADECMKRRKAN